VEIVQIDFDHLPADCGSEKAEAIERRAFGFAAGFKWKRDGCFAKRDYDLAVATAGGGIIAERPAKLPARG
jgi:hypothetical protein